MSDVAENKLSQAEVAEVVLALLLLPQHVSAVAAVVAPVVGDGLTQAGDHEGDRHRVAELDLEPPQLRLGRPAPRAERIREDDRRDHAHMGHNRRLRA